MVSMVVGPLSRPSQKRKPRATARQVASARFQPGAAHLGLHVGDQVARRGRSAPRGPRRPSGLTVDSQPKRRRGCGTTSRPRYTSVRRPGASSFSTTSAFGPQSRSTSSAVVTPGARRASVSRDSTTPVCRPRAAAAQRPKSSRPANRRPEPVGHGPDQDGGEVAEHEEEGRDEDGRPRLEPREVRELDAEDLRGDPLRRIEEVRDHLGVLQDSEPAGASQQRHHVDLQPVGGAIDDRCDSSSPRTSFHQFSKVSGRAPRCGHS